MLAVHRVRLAEGHAGVFLREMLETIYRNSHANDVAPALALRKDEGVAESIGQPHEAFIGGPGQQQGGKAGTVDSEDVFFLGR